MRSWSVFARGLALALAVLSAMSLLGFFRAGAWLVDARGQPRPTDFFTIWSAGYQVSHGAPAFAYDLAAIEQIWSEIHGPAGDQATALPYSPPVLFGFAPFGLIPYLPAAVTWIAIGVGLYLAAVGAIVPRSFALTAAAAAPVAWWNAYTVQTGFLTSALIGGFLVLLERRKIAAGVLLGLLSFKPQLGILFPIVLIATAQWRVIASATITVASLIIASLLAFGTEIWVGFARALIDTGDVNLVRGASGWPMIQSPYGFVRSIGGSADLAWTCHAIVAATVGLAVCWLWRRRDVGYSVKASALSVAAFIVTPYLHAYDLVGLAVPFAFLVRGASERGFLRGEPMALVGLFIGSSLLVQFGQPLPCGPVLVAALGICIVRRARRDIAPGDEGSAARIDRRECPAPS